MRNLHTPRYLAGAMNGLRAVVEVVSSPSGLSEPAARSRLAGSSKVLLLRPGSPPPSLPDSATWLTGRRPMPLERSSCGFLETRCPPTKPVPLRNHLRTRTMYVVHSAAVYGMLWPALLQSPENLLLSQ